MRKTVKIHGNVVKADHGATVQDVLGSGDGGKVSQAFPLKQKPLSHTAAPTPSGIENTLNVFVNDIRWHVAVRMKLGHLDIVLPPGAASTRQVNVVEHNSAGLEYCGSSTQVPQRSVLSPVGFVEHDNG